MNRSWLGPIQQISFATDDLDRMLGFWEHAAGIGPFHVFRNITLSMRYEGKPIRLPAHVAIACLGDALIELIEVAGPGPSPFHDGLGRPIIGLQRVASFSTDIEADAAAAEARGLDRFAEGGEEFGQRYVYFRSPDAPGVILELLELTPSFRELIGKIKERARNWQPASVAAMPMPSVVPTGTETMKAVQLHEHGSADVLSVETIPVPVPGPGEILVRIAGAAVNPVDVKLRSGALKEWMPLDFPARLGGDVAGIVEALGPGVTAFKPGDRVMGMVNPARNGAYAEKITFQAATFVPVPEALSLADAAALPTGVLTGTQLIEAAIKPGPGTKLLVLGAGGSTGRAAVYAALDAGAEVYAGVRASSRDAVADLPVTAVVDISDAAALASAGPFDAVADTVGGAAAQAIYPYIKPSGIMASIAVPPPEPPAESPVRYTTLIVSFDGPRLVRFAISLAEGSRSMPIAHRLKLEDAPLAHRLMEQGGVGGKIVLVP